MIERNNNARLLSRIGYVSEEIKNLENEVSLEIESRGTEIGNNEAECILTARATLESSLTAAGEVIRSVATSLSEDLITLNEIAVHPIFEDIEFLISVFEVEILNIFSFTNSVTNMIQVLIILESEIRAYGQLFEYFVTEVYVEMIIHGMLTVELNRDAFSYLNYALGRFTNSSEGIRSSLIDCN